MSDATNTDELFTQIRTAHRFLAAYYQRLLPTIEQIATQLELDFYFWLPQKFDRPSQLTTNPFNKWQWDMLPALSTYYTFKKVEDINKLRLGEYLITFWVISDTGVNNNEMNDVQIDALSLKERPEDSESIIKIGIFTPNEEQDTNWYRNIWSQCPHPQYVEINEEPIVTKDADGYPIVSGGFQVPITKLMTDDGIKQIINKTQTLRDQALLFAKEVAV
ncbi:hypothetical protein MACH09_38020 [Vibrio sp. MACH09]|uniref:hypothetical protein n=1 Tax=Vibrio sp. MACH09 TaxID=3025122 RepID=UPI00278D61E3|nr:hypothetical protein [Vibrio sp. MACH09]GLO63294.1 hypothetical protein MACH09_38020 [Vibrio sp. MACH09]